jgi:hypothetical protein
MNNIKRYANFESRIVNIKYISEYRNFSLPSSQREKEWMSEQNSKFILSILENKPLGSLILNKRNNKTYILDGQHRINALELFIKNNYFIRYNNDKIYYNNLSEDEKIEFNDTEIFIREYNNLSDQEMADIIDSINEGIKNDNITVLNEDNINKINNFLDKISIIIYDLKYNELKEIKQNYINKLIGFVGTIINNYDSFNSDKDYIQLNSHHVKRFFNVLKKNYDQNLIYDIEKFIKTIYCDNLLNNNEIKECIDKYDINNFGLNCLCYKLYEHYKQNNINDNIKKNIINMLKQNKLHFRELLTNWDSF